MISFDRCARIVLKVRGHRSARLPANLEPSNHPCAMGTSDLENGGSVVTNASDDEKSLVKSLVKRQRIWDSGDRVTQLRRRCLQVDALVEDDGGWWKYICIHLYTVQCKPG